MLQYIEREQWEYTCLYTPTCFGNTGRIAQTGGSIHVCILPPVSEIQAILHKQVEVYRNFKWLVTSKIYQVTSVRPDLHRFSTTVLRLCLLQPDYTWNRVKNKRLIYIHDFCSILMNFHWQTHWMEAEHLIFMRQMKLLWRMKMNSCFATEFTSPIKCDKLSKLLLTEYRTPK